MDLTAGGAVPANGRKFYLDALRGFLILWVVYTHVMNFGGVVNKSQETVSIFLLYICLPIFFFVSGYLSYVDPAKRRRGIIRQKLKDRAIELICPTLIFWGANVCIEGSLVNFPGKFWFTWTLFFVISLYYISIWLSDICKLKGGGWIILMIVAMVCCRVGGSLLPEGISSRLALANIFYNIPIFIGGVLTRRYEDSLMRMMRGWGGAIVVMMAIGLFYALRKTPVLEIRHVASLCDWTFQFCIALVVFSFFRNHETFFAGRSSTARLFCFLGRRTLDIYMIHYFFVPSLPLMWAFFEDMDYAPAVMLPVVVVIIAAILVLTLAVSFLLRTNPYIAKWVLGDAKATRKPRLA